MTFLPGYQSYYTVFFIRISRLKSAKFEEYYMSKPEAEIFNRI